MDCSEVREYTDLYVDGEFGNDEREDFEGHLSSCADCRRAVANEREFREVFRKQLPPRACPDHLRDSVLETIDREAETGAGSWVRWLPLAAAAALALVVFWPGSEAATDSGKQTATDAAGAATGPGVAGTPVAKRGGGPVVRAGSFRNAQSRSTTAETLPVGSYLQLRADVEGGQKTVRTFVEQKMRFKVAPPLRPGKKVELLGARELPEGVLFFYRAANRRLNVAVSRASRAESIRPELAIYRDGAVSVARTVRRGLLHIIVCEMEPAALHRLLRGALP